MAVVGQYITQDSVIEALEKTFGQQSTMHQLNHTRRQYYVDDDGEPSEDKLYTGRATTTSR
eukprot:620095-Pyramimonas_sp.AAC.1